MDGIRNEPAGRLRPLRQLVAVVLALAPLAGAQDEPLAGAPAAPHESAGPVASGVGDGPAWRESEPSAPRLLRLSDGLVLRARARREAGRWEVERDGAWAPLPHGAVLSARLERDALADARARLAALRRDDLPGRVQLAAWMLDEGLYEEALECLDDVLAREPDQPDALRLLSGRLPVAVPAWDEHAPDPAEARAELLAYGARCPPALSELVVHQLAEAGATHRNALLAELHAALTSPAPGARAFAALALRRLFPGEAGETLLQRAVLDPYGEVRERAARALALDDDPGRLSALVALLHDESAVLRTHAATALGLMARAAAVAPLAVQLSALAPGGGGEIGARGHVFVGRQVSYVAGYEAEVAQSATIAKPLVGVIQEGATLDVRVLGVGGSTAGGGAEGYGYATETKAIRAALATLTGEPVTDSNAAWKRWWASEGARWMAEHAPGVGAASSSGPVREG